MMAANGDEGDPPSRVGWPVVDTYTGTLAALAVLSALLQRERFGTDSTSMSSMLDASLVLLTSLATPYLVTGQTLPRTGNIGYSGAPTAAVFVARDGARVSLGVVQDNQFAALCRVIGELQLAQDPRFATVSERAKPEHAAALREHLARVFACRDGAEWEQLLNAAGAPCGLVRDIAEACAAARGGGRDLLEPLTVPLRSGTQAQGEYLNAGFLFETDGPGGPRTVPGIGEHSKAVLRSLRFEEAEIGDLIAAGVVGSPT